MPEPLPQATADLSAQIVEKFHVELKASGVLEEVCDRLQTVLLKGGKITEAELKTAIFGEDATRP